MSDHDEQSVGDSGSEESLLSGLPPLEALDAAEAFLAGREDAIINEAEEIRVKIAELFTGSALAWVLLSDETRAQQCPEVIPRLMRLARRFAREIIVAKPLVELLYVIHPEGGAESFANQIVELIELCLCPDSSTGSGSATPTAAAATTSTAPQLRFEKLPSSQLLFALQIYLEFVCAMDPHYEPPHDVRARVPWPGHEIWLPHFDKLCDALFEWWIALADCDARTLAASAGAAGSGARSEEADTVATEATRALYLLVSYDEGFSETDERHHVPRFGWRIATHILADIAARGPSIFASHGLNMASYDASNPDPVLSKERAHTTRVAFLRTFDAAFALAPTKVSTTDEFIFEILCDLVHDGPGLSTSDIVELNVADRCAALCRHLSQCATAHHYAVGVSGDMVLVQAVLTRMLAPPRNRDDASLVVDSATRDAFVTQCRACDVFGAVARRVVSHAQDDTNYVSSGGEIPLINAARTVDISLVRIPDIVETLFIRLLPRGPGQIPARNPRRGLTRAQWALRVLFDDDQKIALLHQM